MGARGLQGAWCAKVGTRNPLRTGAAGAAWGGPGAAGCGARGGPREVSMHSRRAVDGRWRRAACQGGRPTGGGVAAAAAAGAMGCFGCGGGARWRVGLVHTLQLFVILEPCSKKLPRVNKGAAAPVQAAGAGGRAAMGGRRLAHLPVAFQAHGGRPSPTRGYPFGSRRGKRLQADVVSEWYRGAAP